MNIGSLFCGMGGLDLGFVWEGFSVKWSNDIARQACDSYYGNFGLRPICDDVDNVDFSSLPVVDVVVGGPPCQPFSLVGKRLPNDPRGGLVFKLLDVVKEIRPEAFVMENVPGMAASRMNGVPLVDSLEKSFRRLGYEVTQTRLTATDYMVPQRRKRIFILGCRSWKPEEPDKVVFAKERHDIDISRHDLSAKAAIGDLGPCTKPGERATYADTEPSPFARLMRAKRLKTVSLHECPRMSETDRLFVQHIPPGGNYRDIPDSLSTARILKFKKTGGRTTTYGRLHPDRPAYTINTYFRRPNVGCNFHYSELRLITAREAMRFQSIPDHFELVPSSKDLRNALIGNAVPPFMAQAVAWSIKKALYREPASG